MKISRQQLKTIQKIIQSFEKKTEYPQKGYWKELSNEQVWELFVGQVTVVGRSEPAKKLSKAMKSKTNPLSYSKLCKMDNNDRTIIKYINSILREYNIRYAAKTPSNCAKSKAILNNLNFLKNAGGPKKYLGTLSKYTSDKEKINAFLNDNFSYIKLKGTRDLLIELGMVTNAVALDIRIQNIMNNLSIKITKDFVNNRKIYEKVESDILENICIPLNIKGCKLDRIFYQHYDDIMR